MILNLAWDLFSAYMGFCSGNKEIDERKGEEMKICMKLWNIIEEWRLIFIAMEMSLNNIQSCLAMF